MYGLRGSSPIVMKSFDLIEFFCQAGCTFIVAVAGDDGLYAEHHGVAVGISLFLVVPVVIGCGEIAGDEIRAFCRRHVTVRSWLIELLAIDADNAVFDRHMLVAVGRELLGVGIAAVVVTRVVRQEFLQGAGLCL